MVFHSHRFRILLRIILISIFIGLMFFALNQDKWYAATTVSALLALLVLIELFRFIDRSNAEFTNLLQSLKYQDFTRTYRSKYSERSFRELEKTFDEVLEVYKEAKIDQAAQYQYLQIVLDHIQIALVCFNDAGEVIFFNRAASGLFRKKQIRRLDSLMSQFPELCAGMLELEAGKRQLFRINKEDEVLRLAVTATGIRIREEKFKLVSLQDIRLELEEQELDSWQKLIRVLTHEIMNSVTPVSSLSEAVNELLKDEHGRRRNPDQFEKDELEDMYSSLETIEERSKGLLKFVRDYKNLTRLPKPVFDSLEADSVFGHLERLFARDMETAGIQFDISPVPGNMRIWADQQMIQQVLINLINNAMDAVSETNEPRIVLSASAEHGRTSIRVMDNGKGIDPENADKVFIPFFTTRKQGSGIGLSLSRQIMRLHKGSVFFHTDDKGTTFTLEF